MTADSVEVDRTEDEKAIAVLVAIAEKASEPTELRLEAAKALLARPRWG